MSASTAYHGLDHERVRMALEEAEREAADPATKWLSHEEIMTNAARRREERRRVQSEVSTLI